MPINALKEQRSNMSTIVDEKDLLVLLSYKLQRSPSINVVKYLKIMCDSEFINGKKLRTWYNERKSLIDESLYDIRVIDHQLMTEKVLNIVRGHWRSINGSDDFFLRKEVLKVINSNFKVSKFSELGIGSFSEFVSDNSVNLGKAVWNNDKISEWKSWISDSLA